MKMRANGGWRADWRKGHESTKEGKHEKEGDETVRKKGVGSTDRSLHAVRPSGNTAHSQSVATFSVVQVTEAYYWCSN